MKFTQSALTLLTSGLAFAGGSNPAAPVALAGNGIGDLLLAPMYITSGGWSTTFTVVNTSPTLSTVAKVVFYENRRSADVLDFYIFLSPGDAWRGTATCVVSGTNACASITITSTDDSVLTNEWTFASPSSPAVYTFFPPDYPTNLAPAVLGYVGIFEEAAWNLGAAPLAKSVVKARHDQDSANKVTYLESDTKNILTGTVTISNPVNGADATLPMTAWENYDNQSPLSLGSYTVFGGDVGSPAYTNTAQLEQTIWHNNWVYTYDHSQGTTLGSVTFPTRRGVDGIVHGADANNPAAIGLYPFINSGNRAPVQGTATVRDMRENNLLSQGQVVVPHLVVRPAFSDNGYFVLAPGANQLDPAGILNTLGTGSFSDGWLSLNLDGFAGATGLPSPTATPIAGAPAVLTQMNWNAVNGQLRAKWWYPAYDYTTSK